MAADNVNKIVSEEGLQSLDAAIEKLIKATNEVSALAAAAEKVTFNIEGVDSLNQFLDTMKMAQQPIQQASTATNNLAQSINNVTAASAAFDEEQQANIELLVVQRLELARVSEELKKKTKALQENSTVSEGAFERVAELTEAELKLKQEVSNTTQALKSQVKEVQAAKGSMDAMSQTLGQLREKFRSLNAEQRSGAFGANLQKEIYRLDTELKVLDATIGNSQRNIGNYGSALDKLGTVTSKIGTFITRDVFRSIASGVVFGIAATGIQMLVDYFMQSGDAAEKAKKATDKYAESIKSIGENASASAAKESAQVQILLSIAKDVNQAMNIRIRAVDELQNKYPDYLGNLSKEAILTGNITKQVNLLNDALYEKALAEAAEDKVAAAAKRQLDLIEARKDATKEVLAAQRALDIFEKNNKASPTGEFAPDIAFAQARLERAKEAVKDILKQIEEAEAQGKSYLTEAQQHAANAAPLIVDQPKKDRSAKDRKKQMEDAIKEEEAIYKLVQAKNKEAYDASHKLIGVDDIALQQKDEQAAINHATRMLQILTEFHGKVGESEAAYKARTIQVETDRLNVENATNEAEKKIYLEIQKRHEEANKALDAEIIRMSLLRDKLQEIDRQISDVQAKTKDSKDYANGVKPFLEGLGIDTSTQTELRNISRELETAREKLADLEQERSNALAAGKDGLSQEVAIKQQEKSIADLALKQEQERDKLIIESKKRIAQEAVDLVKQSMAAIQQIQDNQFAKQSQQLQIMAQKEQTAYNQKKEAIAATTNYQIVKDNQLSKLAAQHAAKENEIQQQQNELAIKKAKFEKQAAETAIIMNTAIAITKILAEDAYDPAITAVLIGLTTAIGAAQLAAAASAPIPQFWTGGTTETPIFSAGERGMELMTTPDGKSYFSEPTATIYSAPVGTEIIDHATTMKMINYAANGVNSPAPNININPYANDAMMAQIAQMIGNKFEEVGEDLVYAMNRNRTVIPKSESMKETLREINNSQRFGNRK
jgi:hypothetical protein